MPPAFTCDQNACVKLPDLKQRSKIFYIDLSSPRHLPRCQGRPSCYSLPTVCGQNNDTNNPWLGWTRPLWCSSGIEQNADNGDGKDVRDDRTAQRTSSEKLLFSLRIGFHFEDNFPTYRNREGCFCCNHNVQQFYSAVLWYAVLKPYRFGEIWDAT
jgi:hypothetical protein